MYYYHNNNENFRVDIVRRTYTNQFDTFSTTKTTTTTTNSLRNSNSSSNNNINISYQYHPQLDTNSEDEVVWEWHKFHTAQQSSFPNNGYNGNTISTMTTNSTTTVTATITPSTNNMLISQYDSGSIEDTYYGTLLNYTSRVNKAYAKRYQCDYVILHGIAFHTILDGMNTPFLRKHNKKQPPASRAAYNKIILLQQAIARQYDYLVILDSDAIIYDFTRDLSTLVPHDKLLFAHQVKEDDQYYWNINNGVIVFNLRHPMIHRVVILWDVLCRLFVLFNVYTNDQKPLQWILKVMGAQQLVEMNRIDFAYDNGMLVKHYLRSNSFSWTTTDTKGNHTFPDERTHNIQRVSDEVCQRYTPICD
jgi:hypothetical protein